MQPGWADGQGTSACFSRPTAVVFNSADNMLYVADSHNNCIRRIDASGNVTTYAGTSEPGLVNGSLSQARFSMPTDLVILNGFMYISDSMNNVIRRIDMNACIVSTFIS
jgi:DNA-binding beta-propeller fold protein YncE